MALARMPCSPPAAHRCLVMARTPPLAEPCGTWPTNRAPSRAAIEATLMTEPPPRFSSSGHADRTEYQTMSSSFVIVKCQSSSARRGPQVDGGQGRHPAPGRGHQLDRLGAGLVVQVAAEHRRALRGELQR